MKDRQNLHQSSAKPLQRKEPSEPDLVMLLGDPDVRLLMQVDNVDEGELRKLLRSISEHLQNAEGQPKGQHSERRRAGGPDVRKYRRGVGIMLVNGRNEVFIARRNDVPGEAWQMPQGGIDRGETPRQAALRELKEEIGTANADIIAESNRWLYYDLPEDLAKKAWGGRWKGQRQKWFVMLFRGDDAEINLATEHPEFDVWRWVAANDLESLAVTFKRQLYVSVLGEFASIFRD
jgi:putative (di)nucleoside polyphosphate hydrolase